MPKQKVPDIDFKWFVIGEIKELLEGDKIYINKEYQRGDIWKKKQQIELIKSIDNRYSVGVLVLFINDSGNYEILDGQQRLLTVKKYLYDELDLSKTKLELYSELSTHDKALLDAYCIYYLKLKSHDPESKEEDIVQTFLRLQEGTPLNRAEKINAHRGKFKDTFMEARNNQTVFQQLGKERRFRWRLLAAELLLLEIEGDFKNLIFPGLDQATLIGALENYSEDISQHRVRLYNSNLDFLYNSLNIIITAFTAREVLSFYFLVSYLKKHKADKSNLHNEIAVFAVEFFKDLNNFSMYDLKPPKGMTKKRFELLKKYKQEAKIYTTPESIKSRFEIILSEFNRLYPMIKKDKTRLHDTDQKRILYFRQKGICTECNKIMIFQASTSHHIVPHAAGGSTDDLKNASLMHRRCHERLEARKAKKERLKEKKKRK